LPMIFLILSLLFLVFVMALTVVMQYRRSVIQYKRLAESLCDPGSWNIKFLIRVVLLEGKVDGFPIRYSVLGSPHAESLATSYLLLPYPVKRNLRVYAGSDLSQVDDEIRTGLAVLYQTDGFRNVIFTPADSPFLGKLLSRPLGFNYEPGILLCKLGAGAFNAEAIKSDIVHLIALCKQSV
jgi:hypothetical protein